MTPGNLIAAGLDVTAACRRCGRMVRVNLETYVDRGLRDVQLEGRLICLGAVGDPDRPCGSTDLDLITRPRD